MTPSGDKIRVTARISKELDTKVHLYYTNVAPAIIEGLELLVSMREDRKSPDWHQPATSGTGDLLALIGDKEKQIVFLKEQLAIKDSQLDKQAYSLQSLIQVNSALNMKLLPEKTLIHEAEIQPSAVKESEITTFDSVILSEESEKPIETEKAEYTEFSEMMSKEAHVSSTAPLAAKEIGIEEEPVKPLKEVPQHVQPLKTQKTVKLKHDKEIECANCGKKYTAERSTRKFCSKKCATAYYRKEKRDIIE